MSATTISLIVLVALFLAAWIAFGVYSSRGDDRDRKENTPKP